MSTKEIRAVLKLYYSPAACSMAAHILLEEIGVEYQGIPINILKGENRTEEFLRINPKGFIPVLSTDAGLVSESPAILLYLAQAFPAAGLLPGNDPMGAAKVTSFNVFLASAVHVTYRHISRPRLFADGAEAHRALLAKVPEMLTRYFTMIEDTLSHGKDWIFGERYSASDPYLFVYSSLLFWKGDRGDPKQFPRVLAHRERVLARPATRRALDAEGVGDPAKFGETRTVMALDSPQFEATLTTC
jgi:glutathione S-transferase